ncbi:hypothetical protein Kpol_529p24 [Vanderwaltozyma polyspora DSM 70294]|uniref:Globin domain-containing protein n=1 Tax=Vanderwaltozyma polyspora (strain ATCC 22028 / DSM 70294 / BCRC 21397 / CBS 2163 / NBRC 10782 / NRRL Y-8283 / UCD 57-17) TaxID=436907 RepID=A7TM77_VANPO|nr:uncharacterized protein Kpol_529p24 [Vanderwaltozyma polyspora DSM 70294]EDO16644.1 hypothetical protein Kpol_529p24 [Vanderwaltozyma polyspora DSM 70294]
MVESVYELTGKSQIDFLSDGLDSVPESQLFDSDDSQADEVFKVIPASNNDTTAAIVQSFSDSEESFNEQFTRLHVNDADISMPSFFSGGEIKNAQLNLTPREILLVRKSWGMLLDDEVVSKSASVISSMLSGNDATDSGGKSTPVFKSIEEYPYHEIKTEDVLIAGGLFYAQFYGNLISIDPKLDKEFPTLKHQASGFAMVLNTAVINLEDLTILEQYLKNLGKRHFRILGIQAPNFELMGAAFIKTLRDRIGIYYTIELEKIWTKIYYFLANSILKYGADPMLDVNSQEEVLVFSMPTLGKNSNVSTSGVRSNKTVSSNDVGSKSLVRTNSGKSNSSAYDNRRSSGTINKSQSMNQNIPSQKKVSSIPNDTRLLRRANIGKKIPNNKKECILM